MGRIFSDWSCVLQSMDVENGKHKMNFVACLWMDSNFEISSMD